MRYHLNNFEYEKETIETIVKWHTFSKLFTNFTLWCLAAIVIRAFRLLESISNMKELLVGDWTVAPSRDGE